MNFEAYKKNIQDYGLEDDQYIIGIDLGTTHSVIAYWSKAKNGPEPLDMSNGFGKIPMPSVVQYRKDELDEEWIVGVEAYNSYMIFPENTVMSVKSKMGSDDKIQLGFQSFSPEEISAKILKQLLNQIESINPNAQIVGVVVSVPYDFDDAAKKATIKACHLAGFGEHLICLIEEPKAAALAYNYQHPFKQGEKIMVFDFGGGTLDITLFEVQNITEKEQTLKVISEGGEAKHGGDILDQMLYVHFMEILTKKDIDISNLSLESKADLRVRAKETKERLTGTNKVRVPFTFCSPPFVVNYTREEFEGMIQVFIEKTKNLVHRTLNEAYKGAVKTDEVTRVLLEGGSSQMPWVKEMMTHIFHDASKIYVSERPALDIAIGATLYAAMKIGIHEQKDVLTGRQLVNFEVCVPHDIGFEIEMNNKATFYSMIRRGTPYQLAKRSQVFTLDGDNEEDMTRLSFRILERIHKEKGIEGCSLIGDVEISGLPKRPSGETQLKVELSIDENSGTVKGSVQDIGYKDIHNASGFKASFLPKRHELTELTDER